MPSPTAAWNAEQVLARYEQVRHRCPNATFPTTTHEAHRVLDVAHDYDVVVMDAYGVLKVGQKAIEGAPECVRSLRQAGKRPITPI